MLSVRPQQLYTVLVNYGADSGIIRTLTIIIVKFYR